MKIKVTTEFTDKYTGELHRVGEEMEVSVQRVNEILSVGAFIELVEQSEHEIAELSTEDLEESETDGGQTEETPKQSGRRKRSK